MLLKDYLYKIESETGTDFEISLVATCPVYAGHFPGNPITPGVCLLQIVGELLERSVGRPCRVIAYKNVKYLHTLSPTQTAAVHVRIDISQAEGDTLKIKAVIHDATTEYTRISATYK